MSEQGPDGTHGDADSDREAASGEIVETHSRGARLANIDTASMAVDLRDLFDRVMSGKPYDEGQVRDSTKITDTMVKVLRFEFDVYKHFAKDTPGQRGRPAAEEVSVSKIAEWLRARGDKIEKGAGVGLWVINGRHCEERDLIIRANNMRNERGEKPFHLD